MIKKLLATVLAFGTIATANASDKCENARFLAAIGKTCVQFAVEYPTETCYSIGTLAVKALEYEAGVKFPKELRNGIFLLCSGTCDVARTKGKAVANERLDAVVRRECGQ